MKFFQPFIDFIVFSNSWIAAAAVSLYLTLASFLHLAYTSFELIFIFSATQIAYSILKWKGVSNENNESIFHLWIKRNKTLLLFLIVVNSVLALFAFFQLHVSQWLIIGMTIILGLLYLGVNQLKIRSFWFVKTQMVALVWMIFNVGLLCVNIYDTIDYVRLVKVSLWLFFLVLGLTIPFEIRDWKADKKSGDMTTIPMKFGLKGTIVLSIIHLLIAQLCLLLFTFKTILFLPLFIVAIGIIYRLNQDSDEYQYTLYLDGILVLYYPYLFLIEQLFT